MLYVLPVPHAVEILIWMLAAIVGLGIFFGVLSCFVASFMVYDRTFRRSPRNPWNGDPASFSPEQKRMDAEGMAWYHDHETYARDVHIVRDGLRLYGQYFDFGSDRAVIMLSGRTDCHRYAYFYAKPYAEAGLNVLVIDARAHGKSDGEFNSLGFEEGRDALAWASMLHEEQGIGTVIFHGICIGAAAGMLAITASDCPDYIKGIVTDGMFPNFGESLKNHLIERKKPIILLYWLIHRRHIHFTGHDMDVGPLDVIGRLDRPLLMLHGLADRYSKPDDAQKLFDLAGTEQKSIVWFEKGEHSLLRYIDAPRYDEAIRDYLAQHFAVKTAQTTN